MRPTVSFLSDDMIQKITDQALDVLHKKGIMFENEQAVKILAEAGANVESTTSKVFISPELVEEA